jgi:hypothetical protein
MVSYFPVLQKLCLGERDHGPQTTDHGGLSIEIAVFNIDFKREECIILYRFDFQFSPYPLTFAADFKTSPEMVDHKHSFYAQYR